MVFTVLKWISGNFNELPVYAEGGPINTDNFINQDNHASTVFEPGEQVTIVNFFFTSCPIICPKMTRNIKVVHDYYVDDRNVSFVSFTVDPEKDDPTRLKNYINNKEIDDHNWKFLTGDKSTIYKLARNDFKLVAAEAGGEMPDFIHSDKVVLLDAKKRIRGYYSGTDEKEIKQLITDIKKLKHESSNFITQ